MSTLVTKALAAGAAVTLLTLPGIAPTHAAPLGNPSEESSASQGNPDRESSIGAPTSPAEAAPESPAPAESAAPTDAPSADPNAAPAGTKVQLLGITDFHGRIVEAGSQVASVVEEERAKFADVPGAAGTAFLSAGDSIGASTYVSSSQNDSPTIDVLNAIGLQGSATGNHEYDKGIDDLTGRVSAEADFPYLAANVYDKGTTNVVDGLDAYTTLDVGGVKVAVIGVVTQDTTSLVSPEGIADVDFGDPTDAVNRVADELEALPEEEKPDMTVVEAHLGASSTESLEAAEASNAEFKKLVTEADPSVDAMLTGHTHLPSSFDAPVPGDPERTRPVIQAGNYGSVVGQLQLESLGNGDWTTATSELLSTEDKDYASPVVDEVKQIIADADEKAKGPGSVVAGTITEDITRAFKDGSEDRGAESTLGNLVADALKDGVGDSQLAPADFGITNPGGLRTDLKCDDIYNTEKRCEVTAAELNAVLPFANDHGVVTMKGADVIGLFEEQWQPAGASRPFLHLGISKELDVVYDSSAEAGKRVKSVKVNGEEIDPNRDYRVATLSFLAAGGDNFSSFAKGTFEQSGLTDFETWTKYFNDNSPVAPDKTERQADAAKDVIANGELNVDFTAPADGIAAGGSGEFLLTTDAKAEVPGPVDVTVDVPEGFTVEAGQAQSATAPAAAVKQEAGQATITLESIPAGQSEVPITVSAPEDASGEVTATATLLAGEAEWWDDNPLPLPHAFEATADVTAGAGADAGADGGAADAGADGGAADAGADGGSADASGGAKGSDGGSNAGGSNAGGSSSAGGSASSAGGGSEASAGKDGGDLPRTGFEAMNLVAAALALIIAGGAVVTAIRRKKADAEV
ncbi:bifunctional metallophosphatase/5'-nucleotidase [Brevibacterium casei]|uniref:Bifunctional metallophosphatase/5'-nucleotidase n=1 Tax=Brevibacterium casei TaxID=33889 RepID=A0A269ZB44_9MICO|nr:bifunctional UDP-sugar hydrolase/5'-nucleotidase [Brevibacterium casei]PAK94975.1 bifunctional metallophosphatase/5'-nucleotidase [Brevibacterium casei]